jgi:NADPH-dependent 2,4-dienoyl-CoA reductase/sulfur reductase-like enzyme
MTSSKYIILGGGMVAGYAAKELATRGLSSGELTIISADDSLPYERPPLSKGFLAGKEEEAGILINKAEWYKDHGIEVKLKTVIETVDISSKRLVARSGDAFGFETLLIATGARPRKLECPGNDLPYVYYLRSVDDSRKIRAQAAKAKKAVVIGGGFIGMEVASVLAQKKIETTLIVREEHMGSRIFSVLMSEFFEKYFHSHGVQMLKDEGVASMKGTEQIEVTLSSGKAIECDLVVAGVGATPVTELLAGTGVTIENGVVVDEYLETNQPNIFAAGDVANFPDKIFNKRRRVEHWDNAVSQGQHWATVVSGQREPFVHVPYFFSDVFDLSYELWGDSEGATETVIRGDINNSSFSVWWLNRKRLISAFVMNRPDEEREAAPEWIKTKRDVSADQLKDTKRSLKESS